MLKCGKGVFAATRSRHQEMQFQIPSIPSALTVCAHMTHSSPNGLVLVFPSKAWEDEIIYVATFSYIF